MSSSKQTHEHATIKAWAEKHGGVPALVEDTENGKKGGGILRIHFPEHSDSKSDLKETDWDNFFKVFDDNKLDFLYQDKKADGEESTFHKFIERE
ncbi:hypothetical protein [Pedobacter sp. Leaf176]|uniref:hypothetical protein n=1 Tax=Pedobacter sp. Leaf176 TaxID=1736286 RepID=UPI0006F28963|nr:hypothetical protein [Pedobacter sp. Leaf176]KQR70240.1 1,4-alpha-glucan branching enzyme [Pedobacter sp. Leaf176]